MHQAELLALLVQVVLPLAVGLVTKKSWNKHVKTGLLAAFTAANTILLGLQTGGDPKGLAFSAAVGLAVSLATHYGLYKPAGVTEIIQGTGVADPEESVSHTDLEASNEVSVEDAEVTAEEIDAAIEALGTEETEEETPEEG